MKNLRITRARKILIAEGIFIFGVLIYLFFSTAPNQISPLQGMTIIEPDFVFEIKNGEEVVISTDENFTAPIIFGQDSDFNLPPGTYYWKVKSKSKICMFPLLCSEKSKFRESKVKSFTIQGHVSLGLKEEGENYELQNSGNVELNVTKDNGGLITSMILDVGQLKQVEKDDSSYEGRQK